MSRPSQSRRLIGMSVGALLSLSVNGFLPSESFAQRTRTGFESSPSQVRGEFRLE
jgi:hypothetical protein